MVAVTEEERVPALPVRSSSRELGRGTSVGKKVLLVAMFVGVALIGAGGGLAWKQGLISTTALSTTPQPSAQELNERRQEFLDAKKAPKVAEHKIAHGHATTEVVKKVDTPHEKSSKHHHSSVVIATPEPKAISKSAHPNETDTKKATTKNHTNHASIGNASHRANSTGNNSGKSTLNVTSNLTHNATHNTSHNTSLNVTHNATHNATHNMTKEHTHKHKHRHINCKGGSLAACQCLFACKIFGAQPSQCSGTKVELLDTLIQKALSGPTHACKGMQCIVRCAKSLKCYDDRVQNDCRALENRTRKLGDDEDEDGNVCRYECDKDEKNVTLSQ